MKKFLLLSILMLTSVLSFAQSYNISIGSLHFSSGNPAPASCSPDGSWFFVTDGVTGWQECMGGVYVSVGSGAGVVTGSGLTANDVIYGNGGSAIKDSGIAGANLVLASSPGAGIAHFAGGTQTATSSAVVNADISGLLGLAHGALNLDLTGTGGAGQYVKQTSLGGQPTVAAIVAGDVPTLNQNTTGSAASLSVAGQTGLITLTGITSVNRTLTVRDAADTILELGGSYTPTGTWTNMTLVTPALGTPASGVMTNVTGTASGLSIGGSAASLSVSGQTGLITLTGITSTSRILTVRDAADTILELGGSYTPTGTWTNMTLVTPALGTPASGVMTNVTGTASGLNIGGSAASLSVSGQTGLITLTGITSTNRAKTVRDAADTLLELGGSYTPTGTWTSMLLTSPEITTGINDANNKTVIGLTATASAVDNLVIANAATGGPPAIIEISAAGTDNNVRIDFSGKGTGGTAFASSKTAWDGNGLQTKENNIALSGQGNALIVGVTSQKAETGSADTNVLTVTPAAAVGEYRLCTSISVSSATSGVIGWTATWTDSNGNAQTPTELELFQNGTAAPALTFTTSAAGNYHSCAMIDVNTAGTSIVIKWIGGGTTAAKMTATVERIN